MYISLVPMMYFYLEKAPMVVVPLFLSRVSSESHQSKSVWGPPNPRKGNFPAPTPIPTTRPRWPGFGILYPPLPTAA